MSRVQADPEAMDLLVLQIRAAHNQISNDRYHLVRALTIDLQEGWHDSRYREFSILLTANLDVLSAPLQELEVLAERIRRLAQPLRRYLNCRLCTMPSTGSASGLDRLRSTAERAEPADEFRDRPQPVENSLRIHLFHGNVNLETGKRTGWHYELTGDRAKGTYVIEDTRTQPDAFGVYKARVMIEGKEKGLPSSFFPRHCSPQQVEAMILDAYSHRLPVDETLPSLFIGSTAAGIDIKMHVDPTGRILTAYPVYRGNK